MGGRRDARVDPRRAQAERRVRGVVVGVDQVVDDAGVLGVAVEQLLEPRRGAHQGARPRLAGLGVERRRR